MYTAYTLAIAAPTIPSLPVLEMDKNTIGAEVYTTPVIFCTITSLVPLMVSPQGGTLRFKKRFFRLTCQTMRKLLAKENSIVFNRTIHQGPLHRIMTMLAA